MVRMLMVSAVMFAAVSLAGLPAQQDKKDDKKKVEKKPAPPLPPATAQVKYGPHERNVIDFWQAKSDAPTPVVLYIHGGGWRGGDKGSVGAANIKAWHDAGISVAAINYRYIENGVKDGVTPPVKAPLEDAARALQTIRSKAKEWNIDKKRIGATGGSAGGCSSLWLALHDDLADPKSSDPVARESSRLYCAAVNGAQTSLDPKELREWMPNYKYGAHAFGMKDLDEVNQKRDSIAKWIKEYSPIEHVSKDDPPIALFYKGETNPKKGDSPMDPTHSALLGMLLEQRLKSAGVDVLLVYPGNTSEKYPTTTQYLIDRLKK